MIPKILNVTFVLVCVESRTLGQRYQNSDAIPKRLDTEKRQNLTETVGLVLFLR
jgi:hypothetical protein